MNPKEEQDLAPLITRCPNCATRFRVTEDQLQVAKGQVRCGACLHVFDGTDHLQVDGEVLEAGGSDVDGVLEELEDLEDLDEPTDASRVSSDPPAPGESDDLELIPLGEGSGETPDAHSAELAADSADVLLDSEARLEALEQELMADLKGALASQSSTEVEAAGEDANSRVDLDSQSTDRAEEQEKAEERSATGSEEETLEDWADESRVEEHIELVTAQPEPPAQPEVHAAVFEEEKPGRGLGTWLIVLLALTALPAQVLWFQYDDWVKDDTMRPVYGYLCDLLDCELPVRTDVSLIVAKNSVLRDHPDEPGGLIYDALLVNRASFAQPYPFVELTLTTMNGRVVATRRFKPTEYLAGEATNAQRMQPLTPVHISLALKDPGEAPLNFRIRFMPAG